MKSVTLLIFTVACASALCLTGCKREAHPDISKPLQESFQAAEPEVKRAIDTAATSLKAGNYGEATRALAPVVEGRKLTEPQKQAIGAALKQLNQAVASNPSLDTKEMYDLRAKMFHAVDGGQRF